MFDDIKFLRPYFFSLREIDNNVSLDIKLPSTWKFESTINDYGTIKFKIQDKNTNFTLVSLVSNATFVGYESVFEVAKSIITINKENEEKQLLLQIKIKELETLFNHESLEILRDLTFSKNGKQQETTEIIGMVEQGDGEGYEGDYVTQEPID